MENKKEKLEDFKTAITSTIRSISSQQKIEVSFGNQNLKIDMADKVSFDHLKLMLNGMEEAIGG